MPEDSALAWRLWDAWLAADRSGDDEAAARAFDAYARFQAPLEPLTVETEPLEDVLVRLLCRAMGPKGSPAMVPQLEEALAQERERVQRGPVMPPGGRSGASAFYLRVELDAYEVLCARCVPKPCTGPRALALGVSPIDEWERGGAPCARCGAGEVA